METGFKQLAGKEKEELSYLDFTDKEEYTVFTFSDIVHLA